MDVAKRNRTIAQAYIAHEETHLIALVSQDDIPLCTLQHSKRDFVELIEKWERYQHGVEVLIEPENLAEEISEAYHYS